MVKLEEEVPLEGAKMVKEETVEGCSIVSEGVQMAEEERGRRRDVGS